MKQKTGYCIECGNTEPKPIIGKLCSYHYWLGKRKPIAKKPCKINPVSKKRSKQNSEYLKVRSEYLLKNPYCEMRIPGCTFIATDIHHTNKRYGNRLTDSKFFKSTCRHCHSILHDKMSNQEAKDKGFLI